MAQKYRESTSVPKMIDCGQLAILAVVAWLHGTDERTFVLAFGAGLFLNFLIGIWWLGWWLAGRFIEHRHRVTTRPE
jgi:hypothetical protein